MSDNMKKPLVRFFIIFLLLLLFSSVALASGITPRYIYYENIDNHLVRADYSEAVQNLLDGDGTLYDAIRAAIVAARLNDRAIFIGDMDGVCIDYAAALDDGKTYLEARADDPDYVVVPCPDPVKQLVIGAGGVAVEVPIGDEPPGPNVEVGTASAFANALAQEYPVISFVDDITLVDQLPAVDYPVRINLRDHELRLDNVGFRINAQGVVVTAGRFGKIVGENGTPAEQVSTHGNASVTFKGENPATADLGVLNFQNVRLLLNGTSTMTLRDVSFDRADPAHNDIIPITISNGSTLRVLDSIYDVKVGTDVILKLIGTGANSKITGNGRFHGTGKIEIDSTNAGFIGLNIEGTSVDGRLEFAVHRIDIIYDRDIALRLARLTLNNPVWLDNEGDAFDYAELGVKITGSINGSGTIRGRDGAVFHERMTVLNTANIDGLTFRQLRLDVNEDGEPGINVRFSNAAAEPVTFAGRAHAYIAQSGTVTPNRFWAANQVNVPGDLTFIIDPGSSADGVGVGSTDNIEGAGSFVGEGSITYAAGTTLTVLGNQLTFDVRQNVNEDIRFSRLRLLRRVFLAENKTITVFGDIEGSPISNDRGKIIGANAVSSVVLVSTLTPPVTFEYINLENLVFDITSNTNYVESAFDHDLTADISATLTVDNLNVLGDNVFVGGTGTFTGNRVFGLDAINFDDSAGLLVTGSSWFTFEVPIRIHAPVTFADLEFREIIYDDPVNVTVAGDMIAWQDGAGTIHGEIDGRNTAGEAIIIDGNAADDTALYNLTLNNLDNFRVVDRRVYIRDQLGSTKEYPGTTNIGMDVRGDSGHEILFLIDPDTSLIIDGSIKQILQAVDLSYDGGDTVGNISGAVRGQNGPAVIRSTGDNPITIAENSRLLFMGHLSTNLEIDARIDIDDVDRVTMGVINLKRRVTNQADNELYVFPNKIINFHDDLVLNADLAILNDMTADRPIITTDRYDDIIAGILNPVQGTIRGWGENRIRGDNTITLGDRLRVDGFIFYRDLDAVVLENVFDNTRKVMTFNQVVIEDREVFFGDYLLMLEGDLRMVRIDTYPELWFVAGNFANDDNIAILYGNGHRIYGHGGVAFSSSFTREAVAQNVTFDITSTGFPYEVMIYGDWITQLFRPVIFMDVNWTTQTTVQVGSALMFQYPILRFEVKEQAKNLNNGGLVVWKDGATDQTGHEQEWNLEYPANINYFNYVPFPGP